MKSNQRDMPYEYRYDDYMYIYEDYFCLNQYCPEAEETTLSELVFKGKQNGVTVPYGSNQHDMPYIYVNEERLYIFEDSFCLNQDFPEAEEATFSELVFEFKVHYKKLKVKGCGVRLLEDPHCIIAGKEVGNEEKSGGDEDAETRSSKRMRITQNHMVYVTRFHIKQRYLSAAEKTRTPVYMTWHPKYTGGIRFYISCFGFFDMRAFVKDSPAEMAESTADATASNADTLMLQLKKALTAILDDGGVSEGRGKTDGTSGVLEAIDEAIRILNRLREAESKKPESDTSSSASSKASLPKVPREFQCALSYAIMSEPVVIASGHTYEKRYITQWLMYKQTCPKTKEVLSHRLWTPNSLIDGLITEWCRVNQYDRPKPSYQKPIGMFSDYIDALLQRISSPSSVEEQTEAANEVRRQTKRFANVRAFFVAEIPDSITRLISPLSAFGDAVDSNPDLQKNIITTLLNISTLEENKTVVAKTPHVIPLLTKSLKQGTAKTRRNSAEALFLLSVVDANKIIMGSSETLRALIDAIKDGDFSVTTEATAAVFNLCNVSENREKAVSEGLISVLINKIKEGGKVGLLLAVLAYMISYDGATEEMEDPEFIDHLFSILRNQNRAENCENAATIVFHMCDLKTGDSNRERTMLEALNEEERKYGTFTKLAEQGSARAVSKAGEILQRLERHGTVQEPQLG
ncbi:unnamed protein product [Thlaspi arvense]|uniref:RING-type E3 ubiquitin transferase n=1 Tax=Thlaspi arvense TaxID=13288 RepID=A0AAU9SV74_THLAR|nr:unnamed protein product [Thlaspi arvense]